MAQQETNKTDKQKKQKSILISFEGGEGAGETTQISRLRQRLQLSGYDVVALREPGGTVISEQIREILLSVSNVGMSFTTEVLLFQAARAQIYREIVLPSLKAGKIVLMDRSRDSSVVYQGIVRNFGVEKIEELNNLSTKNTYPDLTFLLDVEPSIGLKRRLSSEKVDRLDLEGMQFHKKVRQAYLDLAQKDKKRWTIIDANKDVDCVEEEIVDVLNKKYKLNI